MRNKAVLITGWLLVAGLALAGPALAGEATPWLGVNMQELTPELRDGMDYRGAGGVILAGIVAGSPAEKAGLRKGDVLVRFDSRTVESPDELTDLVRASRVGQSVSLEVVRGGERRVLSAWLAERPAGMERSIKSSDLPEWTTRDGEREVKVRVQVEPREGKSPGQSRKVKRIIIRDGDQVRELKDLDELKDLEHLKGLKGLERLEELKALEGLEGLEALKHLDLPGGGLGVMTLGSRGRLGVRIESLNPKLGDYFGVKDGDGVLVLEVLDGTPAERAGLEPGDVITRVDGEPVTKGTDLVEALRGKEDRVALRVVRHGTERTIEAELESTEPRHIRVLEKRLGNRPGVQTRIIQRGTDRQDLRHELDLLKERLEELRQRLEETPQGDDGE